MRRGGHGEGRMEISNGVGAALSSIDMPAKLLGSRAAMLILTSALLSALGFRIPGTFHESGESDE